MAIIESQTWDIQVEVTGSKFETKATKRKENLIEMPIEATTKPASIVKIRAQELYDARITRDYEKIVELTWAGSVQECGGRKMFIELMKEMMEKFDQKGQKLHSYRVGEPDIFVVDGGYTFAVLPTISEMRTPDSRIVTDSFALAISPDSGQSWSFVEGRLFKDKSERNAFVPKIPATLLFPEYKNPKVYKN